MLGPESVIWRYAGDARFVPLLGRAFLLQAAHPTIGAGVKDHSRFIEDPFGRLRDSWGLVLQTVYAADGDAVGTRVREDHKRIKGTKPDGSRYHAYEPEAYFWVLATGYDTLVANAERFTRPMSAAERVRAYEEMRELGRRFGLRDRDMPASLADFTRWYETLIEERIERTESVEDVLAVLRRPAPPGAIPALLWPLPRAIAARAAWLLTIGTLTPRMRERLEIRWSRIEEAQLQVLRRGFRATNALPISWYRLPVARDAYRRSARAAIPGGAAAGTAARSAA